jgi:hypothetical protein
VIQKEYFIEKNCQCGISEKTGKWSEKVFDLFGCNCQEAMMAELEEIAEDFED